MKESAAFLIAHQCHSTYFADVCLGIVSPVLLTPSWHMRSWSAKVLCFTVSSWLISESQSFRWNLLFYPLFSFALTYCHLAQGVLTEVFSNRKTNSSLKQHFIFRTQPCRDVRATLVPTQECTQRKAQNDEINSCKLLLAFSLFPLTQPDRYWFCGCYDLAHSFTLVCPC